MVPEESHPSTKRFRHPLIVAAVVVLTAGAFAAIILPLFPRAGPLSAEVDGILPSQAGAGRVLNVDVAIDNLGGSIIDPLCLVAGFDRPVLVVDVVFQGIDHVPFRNHRGCGGKLVGGETVSVRLAFVPEEPGPMHVNLSPSAGDRTVGAVRHDLIIVAPR